MSESSQNGTTPLHNRALLLHGNMRDEILTLREVQQYGIDSFGDPNYVRIYGMAPAEWFGRGIRLLGRTTVECTRDVVGDRIGRDVAGVAAKLPSATRFVVIDPFAGSCNTLYWILRHVPNSEGIAFELDPQVYALTTHNIAALDKRIELVQGDYQSLLEVRRFAIHCSLIAFIAPPWGDALDEVTGLNLRRTTPPIANIIGCIFRKYSDHNILFAIQVYEKMNPDSLADLQEMLDWSELRV